MATSARPDLPARADDHAHPPKGGEKSSTRGSRDRELIRSGKADLGPSGPGESA